MQNSEWRIEPPSRELQLARMYECRMQKQSRDREGAGDQVVARQLASVDVVCGHN